MRRTFILIGLWMVVMLCIVMILKRDHKQKPVLPGLYPAPDVMISAVTSDSVKRMRLEDLKGEPWVANFIFTRCGGPCPVMSGKMAALQRVLPSRVKLISFTVDPNYDSEAILKAYAKRFQADPSRWIFARTSGEDLYRLVKEGFKLPIQENEKDAPTTRIIHSTHVVLVDASGMICAYYDSTQEDVIKRLRSDVDQLLKKQGVN